MNKVHFTGRLIYFDYQQRNCTLDYLQTLTINKNVSSSGDIKHHRNYYRSTLSFRNDHDDYKLLNPTQLPTTNSSLLSNDNNITLNTCHTKIHTNDEYFSFSSLNSQLTKSSQLYVRPLFDALNLIIRMLTSNLIDCKTYRLKALKKKSMPCNLADVNIYSTSKSSSNQYKKQIELIGRYSTLNNHYQSCIDVKQKDVSIIKNPSSLKVYYITSLFDEPFVMLRKRSGLHMKYNQPQTSLVELQGRIFDFHELEGFCVDLAEKVCSILKITCQFRIVQDGNFGSKNASTGIWNGKSSSVAAFTMESYNLNFLRDGWRNCISKS
jgi:hypothetical protein